MGWWESKKRKLGFINQIDWVLKLATRKKEQN